MIEINCSDVWFITNTQPSWIITHGFDENETAFDQAEEMSQASPSIWCPLPLSAAILDYQVKEYQDIIEWTTWIPNDDDPRARPLVYRDNEQAQKLFDGRETARP